MASLWEILDVNNMTYDYDNPAAYVQADGGFGPPNAMNGWVHTGYSSSGSNIPGQGNCLAWTDTSNAKSGVSVQLSYDWEDAPGNIGPWVANSYPCNFTGPVWCVGDFNLSYLPFVKR